MSTCSFKDISCDDLTFTYPERLGNCYMCNLYYDENLVYVQTPILEVNNIEINNDNNDESYINISCDNKQFIDFLLEMDENCVKSTFNNSCEWFKKDIPYEAIDNMYNEIDVEMNEEETIYYTKLKLPVINNKIQCNTYNREQDIIDISDINGKNVIMILHFKGLKILKNNFYLDCYINQIKLVDTNKYNILDKYSILEDSDEESIDENMFSDELFEIQEKEKLEKLKSEKLEKINKLKEELENLNN